MTAAGQAQHGGPAHPPLTNSNGGHSASADVLTPYCSLLP